ncbi:IgGFc-binding protein-like [Dreissena polymorpha]|uniref:IgGFc-binding protein-like n=1 Tax=Dreissena polymorpha TaxID=45954 RepID=UPI0022644DF6|nr:IgGFc-binding protein-like [Dreissena polymorpha]
MNNFSQSLISEQNKLSTKIDKADAKIVKLDVEAKKLDGFSRIIEELITTIDCKDPTPDHGTVNTTATTYGTVVKVSCNHGYVLSGTNIITCKVDSSWSESATCIPYDCEDPTPDHGTVNTTVTTYGTVVKISCNHGYVLSGENIIECNADSDWSASATCNPYDCGDPTPDHGTVNTTVTTYGTVVQISCNHGYVLSGENIIKCNVDSDWSASATCIPYDCGDPTPDHGTVNTTVTTYGTVVQISCNHGYVLSGENIIKCNVDSDWSASATCNPYDCGDPTPDHGTVNTTVTTYGTVVKISCNNGYVLSGENIIKCNADSDWSASATCNLYDSAGRQFIFGIPETSYTTDYIKLYIASKHVSKVYITAPGIGFNQTITTLANTSTAVVLPGSLVTTTGLSNKAVYVEANQTISIYVMVRDFYSSDGFLLLPISADAREFVVASYEPYYYTLPSEFLIIALEDSTLIDIQLITSDGPVIIGGQSYSSGQNVSLKMSRMQTYLVQHEHDLTGTHITSSKPVSVVSGVTCANVPQYAVGCDFLVEQMLPVSFWQREYVCAKLKSRGINRLRILSSVDGTSVNIGATHIKLNKGEFYEYVHSNDVATPIESNFPVLVLQYAEGRDHDSKLGDPSMITIPSLNGQEAEYFYETATPLAYHYVSITIRTDQANGLHIDGSTVSRVDELKTTINTTEFSVIRLSVTVGKHHIYHVDTYVRFGVIVYGFDYAESYGFPLGLP